MTDNQWQQRAREVDLCVRNFIDGQYIDIASNDYINKYSPRDGSLLYRFGIGTSADVDRAVASARTAFDDARWQGLTVHQRKDVLQRLANLVEANAKELALYECLDVGKPITKAVEEDVVEAALAIRSSAEGADKLASPYGSDSGHFVYHVRRPVGVVGGIVGWNYPLVLAASKVGPALAMGNSLVLKPSEFTSLSACRLAELAVEAGVPPGVFNVVHGAGTTVGDSLARHQHVDLLSFTGSSATGKQIMAASGQSNMKRVILECGGKSPYLVFEDCPSDLDAVAADVVARAFANQGALCVAGTRVLIQESIKERLLPKILQQAAGISPCDPLDPMSRFGALVNESHMNKVLAYIDSGKQQGAELVYGGKRIHADSGGYYIEPTVFDHVDPQQVIAQEEIFGPVLCVFTFSDEQQAITLANDTCYGLAAYAATENIARTIRLGQQLRAGLVKIIGAASFVEEDMNISIEPHKQSGFGHEGGLAGLASYTTHTAVRVLV